MSVQSEITRIGNAKTAIKNAIEGKGVTVPSGTKLDGMAALIDGVSGGDGVTIKTVKYVPPSNFLLNNSKAVITHSCGKIPKAVFIFSTNTNSTYFSHGYILNTMGNTSTSDIGMFNGANSKYTVTFRVSFTSTTMAFTSSGSVRYFGQETYTFYFIC